MNLQNMNVIQKFDSIIDNLETILNVRCWHPLPLGLLEPPYPLHVSFVAVRQHGLINPLQGRTEVD